MFRSKLTGKQKVFSQLKRIAPEVDRDLDKALNKNVDELAIASKSYAPKNTGDYAKSLRGGKIKEKAGIPAYGLFASYVWRFIEFGTQAAQVGSRILGGSSRSGDRKSNRTHPGTPARPHIFPAFRSLRKRMVGRVTRTINKSVRQATGR